MKKIKLTILLIAAVFAFSQAGCVSKGVKKVKYDNGLVTILKSDKNTLAASVAVYVRAGSVDENPEQAGLSHFLEHLMFKGSKNYPGDELSRKVENMGGYINAATSKEYTMYYIDIQKDGVEEAVKMLADTMQNPLFPQDEIDRERKVVIEEIQRHSDNPVSILYETFFETIYEKSALKNSIIGNAKVISSVSREEIYSYYARHYVPGKMTVVISGNFDEDKIRKTAAETFGKFEPKVLPEEPDMLENVHKAKETVKKDKVETGYAIFGFLGPDMNSDDIFCSDIAYEILGGGKSSRLYRVLKEEKHLVYSIGASFMTVKGTGALFITAVFDPKNYEEIKKEINIQIQNIVSGGVSEDELRRAKLSIKTDWSFTFEKPFDIGFVYGYWQLMGKPEAVEEYITKTAKLTIEDVRGFFKKYYAEDKVTVTALLPEK